MSPSSPKAQSLRSKVCAHLKWGMPIPRIGVVASAHDELSHAQGTVIGSSVVVPLKHTVESKTYSEIDLVLWSDRDPQRLVLDYLS